MWQDDNHWTMRRVLTVTVSGRAAVRRVLTVTVSGRAAVRQGTSHKTLKKKVTKTWQIKVTEKVCEKTAGNAEENLSEPKKGHKKK